MAKAKTDPRTLIALLTVIHGMEFHEESKTSPQPHCTFTTQVSTGPAHAGSSQIAVQKKLGVGQRGWVKEKTTVIGKR